jgi:peptidoglycan/LPS O-acetylase OafA/YrhL
MGEGVSDTLGFVTKNASLEERDLLASIPGVPEGRSSTFRPDIQGMRAVAVILVILVHASVPGVEGGYVGVDVFFVISGFVITRLLLRQPRRNIARNLGDFYANRIRRIVPAATLALVVTVIAAYALLGVNFDTSLLIDVRWASLFGENFRLIHTASNYFVPGLAPSLVTHFWSLAVEEQFYLCYPIIIFSLTWVTPRRYRILAIAIFLVMAIAISAWWSWHLTTLNPVAAYYSPFTRFWELALGGLTAVIPAQWARRTPKVNSFFAVAAVVALCTAAVRLSGTSVFPGVVAWWPCLASATLLWTGQSSVRGAPASWLSWRPLRYIGDISYSLYLWHYPWLILPEQMVHPLTSPFARVIEIMGATACAVVSFHLVENPIRHSRRLLRDGWATALLLFVCVALSWDATLLIARLHS